MVATAKPLPFSRAPRPAGAEIYDLICNTPPEQREYMLECLRITLDNAHTLYCRSDYDDPHECCARLRFVAAVSHTLMLCRQQWG